MFPPRQEGGEPFREQDPEGADFALCRALSVLERFFREDGNPAHAIQAVIYCYDSGIAPPVWAMDWLVGGLREFMKSEGREDIVKLLSLDAIGGVSGHFAESRQYYRAWLMHRLCEEFGYSQRKAAQMVCAREPGVDPETLRKYYRTKWKSKLEQENALSLFEMSTEEERSEFLESFSGSALDQ